MGHVIQHGELIAQVSFDPVENSHLQTPILQELEDLLGLPVDYAAALSLRRVRIPECFAQRAIDGMDIAHKLYYPKKFSSRLLDLLRCAALVDIA